jgi:hypothetical protein
VRIGSAVKGVVLAVVWPVTGLAGGAVPSRAPGKCGGSTQGPSLLSRGGAGNSVRSHGGWTACGGGAARCPNSPEKSSSKKRGFTMRVFAAAPVPRPRVPSAFAQRRDACKASGSFGHYRNHPWTTTQTFLVPCSVYDPGSGLVRCTRGLASELCNFGAKKMPALDFRCNLCWPS